jgi:hypothetical protein
MRDACARESIVIHKILLTSCLFAIVCWSRCGRAQDAQFSGPQVGEPLAPFTMRLARGEQAGEEFDPVTQAQAGPTLVVFVHEVTRPSAALIRSIVKYAGRFHEQGLQSSLVFLTADPTETQALIRRAHRALPEGVPMGISVDGLEGPGAYGLNRKMTLTVLLGNDQHVTANFALIQPSLATDAPRIGAAIEKLMGNDHQPTLAEMGIDQSRR